MSFSINCTTKGCQKLMQPYLDPKTDKVYCSICDSEISQVTSIIKNQLKLFKKFRPKKVVPYAVKCPNCNLENTPILLNKEPSCPSCKSILTNLSEPFKLLLKTKLSEKDV